MLQTNPVRCEPVQKKEKLHLFCLIGKTERRHESCMISWYVLKRHSRSRENTKELGSTAGKVLPREKKYAE